MKKIMYKSLILIMLLAVAGSMSAQSYGAEMPQAGFSSTGTMMGSGSAYSSTPTISDNGMAGDPYAAAPSSSRPGARKNADMPEDDDDDDPNPIGEPLVMLFFAAAAAAAVALRRRKAQA